MPKHTKGPWEYVHENGNNPRIVSPAIDPGTGKPCVVVDLTFAMRSAGPVETSNEETEANGLVMAAGPEMLDALKEALEVMGDWGDDDDPAWAERARAAIAKAEGRANG